MNYQDIYNKLIEKRLHNYPKGGYIERHHIVMRSMGGSDTNDNLVVLTGREHWIAHLLLYRIYCNKQTIHACHMMAMRCEERGISRIKNSRMYEAVRIAHAKLTSKRMKETAKGKSNSQYGTMWICNQSLKQNKKIKRNEDIPLGWNKGRNTWVKIERENKLREKYKNTSAIKIAALKALERGKKKARQFYDTFINGNYRSINEFAKSEQCDVTQPALSIMWKKHIPEFNAKKRFKYASIK